MTLGLCIGLGIIGIVFLGFAVYFNFLMSDYKEIINADSTDFTKDLVSV